MRAFVIVTAVVLGSFLCQMIFAQQDSSQRSGPNGTGINKRIILSLDPALASLISPDAEIATIKKGSGFTEGITCVQRGNNSYVLLSDMWTNQIYKVTPEGQMSLFLDHSGYTGF